MSKVDSTIEKYLAEIEQVQPSTPDDIGLGTKMSITTGLKKLSIILDRAYQGNNKVKAAEAVHLAAALVDMYPLYWKLIIDTLAGKSQS
jgi:hypothetical protein